MTQEAVNDAFEQVLLGAAEIENAEWLVFDGEEAPNREFCTRRGMRYADSAEATNRLIEELTQEVIHERNVKNAEYREAYDTVLARGVARLNVLCEWCMPFVRVGGRFIAMKGSRGEEELEEAQNAVKTLGGRAVLLKKYRLPDENRDYALIIIEKISATPEMYPRHNSKIERSPL